MANDDADSLYGRIKDSIPYLASAAIGGALGGPAGAAAGLAGAGEQEVHQQDLQAQRGGKMAEILQQSQYHRDMLLQKQQDHEDHEADVKLQQTYLHAHQQEQERQARENTAQRADYNQQSLAERKQAEQDRVAGQESAQQISRALLALHEGNNVDDASWKQIVGNAGPGWAKWANVQSPAARKVAVDQIAKQSASASDAVVQQNLKIINDANGGDMDKTLAAYGSYSPTELNRLAHAIQNKSLKTPDQLEKEAESDAKESANLAGDLKKADAAFGKTWAGGKMGAVLAGGANKQQAARAHAIMNGLVGSTWSGTTDTERAAARRTLRKQLTHDPNTSYEDLAQLLRPKGSPAKAAPASGGGVTKVSAKAGDTPDGALPKGALRASKHPDGEFTGPGGKKYKVKGGYLYPGD